MKTIFYLLIIFSFINPASGQVRKLGTASDSINFTSIVIGPDSSIYFIGSKGIQHILIVKTNRELDTLWSKSILTNMSYRFPNAIYLDQSNEVLINCGDNLLVKVDSSGTVKSIKQLSLPGTMAFNVLGTMVKNDSLFFTVNRTDSSGQHNGIAVADTAGNITHFHDFGNRPMEMIMEYNGGYYVSPAGIIMDSNFNILSEYYTSGSSQFYFHFMGVSTVLNDSVIIGSIVVYNNFGPEADELYKITQSGLQWVVKDDLVTGNSAFDIRPVKLYPNGNIACIMNSTGSFFIGIVDSDGYPIISYQLNVLPDLYYGRIGTCDLNTGFAFSYGNVIGLTDSSGATCLSNSGSMDQYNPLMSIGDSGSESDSVYNLSWNVTSLTDTTSPTLLAMDVICDPVGVEDLPYGSEIVIYPNPWTSHFQIYGLNNPRGKMTITDLSGKIVYESFVSDDEQIFVPGYLSRGSYFVRIDGMSKPVHTIKVD